MKKITFFIFATIAVILLLVVIVIDAEAIRFNDKLEGLTLSVTYSDLNVRSEPSDLRGEETVWETIPYGTEVTLTGRYTKGSGSNPKDPTCFGWVETTRGWVVRAGLDW